GPVTVGVVVVDDTTGRTPAGLRDSKLLRPHVRERLCGPIRRWARASAVGHAGPDEIDRYGIIAALRMAGNRALARLAEEGVVPDVVVLDGKHDWLTHPPHMPPLPVSGPQLPVVMRIKGDLTVTSIAAASVLAKCERDAMMTELHETYPAYGWHGNKGYSAPEHAAALREHGPCELHRRSWSLPPSEVYETEELPLELVGEPHRGAEGAGWSRECRGPRELRDRCRARAVPGVPRRRRAVLLRG